MALMVFIYKRFVASVSGAARARPPPARESASCRGVSRMSGCKARQGSGNVTYTPSPLRYGRRLCKSFGSIALGFLPIAKIVQSKDLAVNLSHDWVYRHQFPRAF